MRKPTPMSDEGHLPVLCAEVVELLVRGEGQDYLDATFGGGGHTRALLEADPHGTVVAVDQDPAAAARAAALKAEFGERLCFFAMNFEETGGLREEGFAGAVFDLGVSSFQLDAGERGFSFRGDAPADMRMNPQAGVPAWEFLESAPREELVRAVRDYGEEPRWRRVVAAIEEARGTGRLARTGSLAEVVRTAIGPGAARKLRIDPATRTFQGIRIYVNRELEALEAALPAVFGKLMPGGVMVAISFHSLEDRLVKRAFRRLAGEPEHAGDAVPKDLRVRRAELLTRKPVVPGEAEQARNPRSRSARLRALRKLPEAA